MLWKESMGAKGWGVPTWPAAYGGGGLSPAEARVLSQEMAKLGAVNPIGGMGVSMFGPTLLEYGTEAQKLAYIPEIATGKVRWCQGFSEPGAGSDLAALQLRATSDGDDYVLNGSKIWTTHAHFANRMFALVRTSSEGKPQAGISFLLLDMATPGIQIEPIRTLAGDHEFNQVFFDDVRVPQANRLGAENQGWSVAKHLLTFERGGKYAPSLLGRRTAARTADRRPRAAHAART
jgi:alkylation response protein AidB-like acyl-CoA dehydrogenase